ncbi:TIGR02099 family protein [Ectothiorhodospiraceae bacterium WFHF3C12]|nr:TIGR02099 family protein [Ectothiorhodospiraceae bacterium WFHF3C12]
MPRRLYERFKTLLVYTTVTVFVLLAVAATLLRLAVAYAPELRAETESYLGEWLQREVSIGGLRARWHGLDPRLIFEDVTVNGEGSSRYRFEELEVAISSRALFTTGRVVPSELALHGVELTVERLPGGELELSADSAPPFLATLPARIRVDDAVVRVVDHVRADVYAMTGARLLFSRADGLNRLSVLTELPDFMGERAEFILHWSDLDEPFADARLYADLVGVRFDALGDLGASFAAVPGMRGAGDMELWISAAGGAIDAASGRVSLQQLGAERSVGEEWFDIGRRLEARFDWRRFDDGWALDVDEIGYAVDQEFWPTSGLSVRYQAQSPTQPERWRAGVEYIELSRLRQLLANLPHVPESVRDWARAVELGGELRQSGFQLQRRDGRTTGYSLDGTLSRGRYGSADGRFAASGLDVSFTANERGGEARVIGRDGELELARLFRGPLPYESLEAEVAWARQARGWRLGLSGLSVRNEDGAARGAVRLFDIGTGNPFIDIRASAQRFEASAAPRYLPVGIMEPDLVEWLDQALVGGRLTSGEVIFHGRAADFPFREGAAGVFEVRGGVADGTFRYFPDWPRIDDLTARLRFTGLGMEIDAESGRILGAEIRRAEARMDAYREARLVIQGATVGPGGAYLDFLRQAPISRRLSDELAPFRLSGRHPLDLRLMLPLKRIREARVDGALRLEGATVGVAGRDAALSAVNGLVRFDERGVSADKLRASWRGQPVDLAVATQGEGRAESIRVTASLSAGGGSLMPRLAPYTTGQARWRVDASLPAFRSGRAVETVPVTLRSDLVGLGVSLPEPIGKSAALPRSFEARLRVSGDGLSPIEVDYGDILSARAVPAAEGGRYGVRLGGGAPELPEGEGLRITGALQRLVLDDLPTGSDTGGEGGSGGWMTTWVDIAIGRLVVGGQVFRDLSVVGSLRPAVISLRLDGPDLAGDVAIPLEGEAAGTIDLRELHLSKAGSEAEGEMGTMSTPAGVLPSLDVDIAALHLDGRSLGRFSAVVDARPEVTRLRRFRLANQAIRIEGSGDWHHVDETERSSINASFESGDVGSALALFGYARTVRDGESEGRMRLEWAGGPLSVSPEKLSGELEFSLRNGRLPAVEPGAGRVFGLLSLATVPRRLTLDFSDLFQEGFSFDEIKARFLLDEGIAEPRIFFIEGPAARIDFSGDIDLVAQRFDQVMTVTPQVSSTLPLIGGLTGGPVAAVVLFVTQQIFQDEMDRLAQYRYRVTGPWRDPEIEPIRRMPPETFEDFPGGG